MTSNQGQTPKKKTVLRVAKVAIMVIVVVGLFFAGRSAMRQWRIESERIQAEIAQVDQQIQSLSDQSQSQELISRRNKLQRSRPTLGNLNWPRIVIAALLYSFGIVIPGFVLHSAVRSLAEQPRVSTAIASQLLGHAGKYVPGKAMVIVLRVGGLAIDGVKPIRATISVFMETLLMMGVGAAVAGVVVWWLDIPDWMKWSALGVAFVASVPTLPPILKRVAAKVSKTKDADLGNVDSHSQIQSHANSASDASAISGPRFFLTGWVLSVLSWILIGASFTFLVSAIPTAEASPNVMTSEFLSLGAVSTAAIALAMVIGFASLLPGGAGIRELVLTTVLATTIGPAQALLAAIAARLLFIVVEAACAFFAWLWLSKQKKLQDR